MVKEVIEAYEKARPNIKAWLKVNHPKSEEELVKRMFLEMKQVGLNVDVDSIVKINNEFTWSLMFVIPITSIFKDGKFATYTYYTIALAYGSHPASDMFLYIQRKMGLHPTKQQVKDYMTMALHLVQCTQAQYELKNIFWDRKIDV